VHALDLQKQLDGVAETQRVQQEQLDALKKQLFGKGREKMPPMEREVRRGEAPDPEKSQLKRRANAALRAAKIKTEVVDVKVPVVARKSFDGLAGIVLASRAPAASPPGDRPRHAAWTLRPPMVISSAPSS
jgi:hypothetical protein